MHQKSYIQSYFWLIAIALVLIVLYYFFSITIYIAISVVIMLISEPLINKLGNCKIGSVTIKIPRVLSTAIILAVLVGIITLLLLAFIPVVNYQINSLSQIEINYLKANFNNLISKADEIYQSIYPNEKRNVLEFFQDNIIALFNPKNISNTLSNTLLITGNIFVALFSILFISFFLIKDKELLKEKIFNLIPNTEKHSVSIILKNCKQTLSRYFIGLLIQVICIFTCNFIGLSILGIKNALLIASISAILNIIPYIGPLMGMVFAFFIVTAS